MPVEIEDLESLPTPVIELNSNPHIWDVATTIIK
jgi:hypothetical protein